MLCAEFNQSGQLVLAQAQPVELAQCQAVVLQGADLPMLSFLSQMPTPADGAQAFAIACATPISFWLLGRAIGAVVGMLR